MHPFHGRIKRERYANTPVAPLIPGAAGALVLQDYPRLAEKYNEITIAKQMGMYSPLLFQLLHSSQIIKEDKAYDRCHHWRCDRFPF